MPRKFAYQINNISCLKILSTKMLKIKKKTEQFKKFEKNKLINSP